MSAKEPVNSGYSSASEQRFEAELIEFLQQIGGTKQWQYEPGLKTTDQLWGNFSRILYALNQDKLDRPLSDTEFAQVKRVEPRVNSEVVSDMAIDVGLVPRNRQGR